MLSSSLVVSDSMDKRYAKQNNAKLFIEESEEIIKSSMVEDVGMGEKTATGEEQKSALKNVIASRFNAAQNAVYLDSLALDEKLQQVKMRVDFNSKYFVNLVVNMMADLFPALEGLSFAHNSIKTLRWFSFLYKSLPQLHMISLEGNAISELRELSALESIDLKDLILKGNPLLSVVGSEKVLAEVRKRFPKLKSLDGLAVAPLIQFNVPKNILSWVSVLEKVQSSFFDSDASRSVVQTFIPK